MNLENIAKLSIVALLVTFLNACDKQNNPQQTTQPDNTPTTTSETEPKIEPQTVANDDLQADDEDRRYYCGESKDGTPTTFARKLAVPGSAAIIRWERDNWQNVTPQERCEQVSDRFERAYRANNLQYILEGRFNQQPVVCGVRDYGDLCTKEENFLLTLQHQDDSKQFITDLQQKGYQAKGPLKTTEDGSPVVYIDMNMLVNLAPVAPESEPES